MTTRDRIFEASVHLFAARGFHGTSIRDIARDVGIKESSIYNHFRGKDAILQSILDYQMDGFREYMAALDELEEELAGVSDALEFWAVSHRAFERTARPLAEPISWIITNEMFLNERCRRFVLDELFAARKELTRQAFELMRQRKLIRECDFATAADQYVAMIHGLDMELSLRLLDGGDAAEGRRKLLEAVVLFIEDLKERKE